MSDKTIWMVRGGRNAAYVEEFIEEDYVAIGWPAIGEVAAPIDKSQLEKALAETHTVQSQGTISVWASQIKRFLEEVSVGDAVATYDPSQRLYFIGEILGEVTWRDHDLCRVRKVKWTHQVHRDSLAQSTRNSLGAISTLFLIKDDAADDMRSCAVQIGSAALPPLKTDPKPSDDAVVFENIATRADEFIEDRISALEWEEMQELVAEVLRAMGYRATVSPKGADRGVDVFASPDGLGLEEPRIFVEVKHRKNNTMSADMIRAFMGGRQPGDKCLYVSTGGFSKEARYEAERSNIPIRLVSLPELRQLVVENYDKFSTAGKKLLPLQLIYWPA